MVSSDTFDTHIITLYLIKNNGMLSALFFAAAFPTMTALVEFHAFRSGDMDSIYCAFFALAMISLLEVKKGRKKYLILYGFALSLAIMTKGIHAGIIFLIGLLMLPQIIKKIDKYFKRNQLQETEENIRNWIGENSGSYIAIINEILKRNVSFYKENPRKEYLRLHLGLKCRFKFSKTHIHVIFKFESEVLVILFNP